VKDDLSSFGAFGFGRGHVEVPGYHPAGAAGGLVVDAQAIGTRPTEGPGNVWPLARRDQLVFRAAQVPGVDRHLAADDRRVVCGSLAADEAVIEQQLKSDWPRWLETKYGTVAAMNRCTRHDSFAEVPGSIDFIEKPFDLAAADLRHYLNDRGYHWCKGQCDVIRSVDPLHMIVSGNNGWLSPDMDLFLSNGFQNIALHDLFDFVTFHPYPAWQCLPGRRGDPLAAQPAMQFWLHACIGMARLDHYNKPVVVQEFGWYGGGESSFLCPLPHRSEAEHAQYTQLLCDALTPHVNGFLNWPTFDMPAANDISNHGGIFTHDGGRKALTGDPWPQRALAGRGAKQRVPQGSSEMGAAPTPSPLAGVNAYGLSVNAPIAAGDWWGQPNTTGAQFSGCSTRWPSTVCQS
jgi:hypothetical protein